MTFLNNVGTDEIAQWLGYGVMAIGGALLVLVAFYLTWCLFCGAAIGVVRSLRAIKAAQKGVKP